MSNSTPWVEILLEAFEDRFSKIFALLILEILAREEQLQPCAMTRTLTVFLSAAFSLSMTDSMADATNTRVATAVVRGGTLIQC